MPSSAHRATRPVLRALLAAALLALAACAQRPRPPQPPFRIDVIDAGVYAHVGAVVERSAPNTAAGWVAEHDGLQLLRATTAPAAARNLTFGFRYRITRVANGPVRGLSMRALHPAMRGRDGHVRESSTAWTEVYARNGVAHGTIAYTMREPFEVLRGTWTLEILWHDVPVASRTFELK